MRILVVDVGGNNVKLLVSGQRSPRKVPSGPALSAARMVAAVREAMAGTKYDAVTIGFPGPVNGGRPAAEPVNLGRGWVRFDYARAFGKPVRVVNDAAMQALGSYRGGRMLFLGLGTGLGSALVLEGLVQPLEMAHLSYRSGKTYEDFLGKRGLDRVGKKRWRQLVHEIVPRLHHAFQVDEIVLGGGNAKQLKALPPSTRLGSNANAFVGGFRLWERPAPPARRKSAARRS
ncbi:MAG TPA: ROK family protein [Vicinamibacteria bacterium]|nr:ROK family protein [Vicinamibacteria bacterium]